MKPIGQERIGELISAMAQSLHSQIPNDDTPLHMIGIHTGGFWIAQHLHRQLGLQTPLGELNISFYRDDFGTRGLHPQPRPSSLPASLDGCAVILVDDILYTGRTARAALNELFDYGRPLWVKLAVLIDRGGRELPIQADVTGQHLELPDQDHIKLGGPTPLQLDITRADT